MPYILEVSLDTAESDTILSSDLCILTLVHLVTGSNNEKLPT